jgi:hypothetical protein
MRKHPTLALLVLIATLAVPFSARAQVSIDLIEGSDSPTILLPAALLAPSSGITIDDTTVTFVGRVGTVGGDFTAQSATYSNFVLAPATGSTPTLVLPAGILLTTGSAQLPTTNTSNATSISPGTGGNTLLSTLAGDDTSDANILTFNFTTNPGANSVSAQFVFGTEEFPDQLVTDIFGFFVDGVNYARFPGGELISNTPANPANFISNPVGSGLYMIEYNGLTPVFTVVGLLNPALTVHTLTIGIADTFDTLFDSGVFIGGLAAGIATNGGGIDPGVPGVPDTGSTLGMLTLAALGLGALQRKRSRSASAGTR